ncbi:MAG: hypothetical protein Q9163_004293 [Psora crenata]
MTGRASSHPIPRGTVTSPLNFYAPPSDGSKPYNYVEQPPAGQSERNYGDEEVDVTIHDIRGKESSFNLDDNAFAALQHISEGAERDFIDDASVREKYYPEVEKLLLEHVPGGAKRILLFDHTIRRAANPAASRNPVTRVHIDQSRESAEARVRHHLPPDEAEKLLQGRVRIINVWRPINGPVESFPLAFADSWSIADHALLPVEHRYPTRTGQTVAVRYTPGQRWYYWSGIDPASERLLLQCYDSRTGARVPHTAFVDPRSTPASKPRESIEVRALVFG